MFKRWRYQNLEDERLHYITEWDHDDGIIGEHFFEYNQYGDMIKFCVDHNISFDEIELPIISEVENLDEYFTHLEKLAKIDFSCRIRMYNNPNKLDRGELYRQDYMLTLDMIEQLPAEALGNILKELHLNLKQFIYEKNK